MQLARPWLLRRGANCPVRILNLLICALAPPGDWRNSLIIPGATSCGCPWPTIVNPLTAEYIYLAPTTEFAKPSNRLIAVKGLNKGFVTFSHDSLWETNNILTRARQTAKVIWVLVKGWIKTKQETCDIIAFWTRVRWQGIDGRLLYWYRLSRCFSTVRRQSQRKAADARADPSTACVNGPTIGCVPCTERSIHRGSFQCCFNTRACNVLQQNLLPWSSEMTVVVWPYIYPSET